MTAFVPEEILQELGRPACESADEQAHLATVGVVALALRRDCHGVLRKLEVRVPEDRGDALRGALATLGTWQRVVPGQLEILDVPGLGKLYALAAALNVTVRMDPDRARLVDLVARCLAVG